MQQTITVNSNPEAGESFSVNVLTSEFVADLTSVHANPTILIGANVNETASNIASILNGKNDLEAVANGADVTVTGDVVEIDVSNARSLSVN